MNINKSAISRYLNVSYYAVNKVISGGQLRNKKQQARIKRVLYRLRKDRPVKSKYYRYKVDYTAPLYSRIIKNFTFLIKQGSKIFDYYIYDLNIIKELSDDYDLKNMLNKYIDNTYQYINELKSEIKRVYNYFYRNKNKIKGKCVVTGFFDMDIRYGDINEYFNGIYMGNTRTLKGFYRPSDIEEDDIITKLSKQAEEMNSMTEYYNSYMIKGV